MDTALYVHPDLPVLVIDVPGSQTEEEAAALQHDWITALDSAQEPLFIVILLSHFKLEIDSLISRTHMASASLKHKNNREMIVVTQNLMIDLAARGLNTPIFGNIRVRIVPTNEAAFEYVQAQIAIDSQATVF